MGYLKTKQTFFFFLFALRCATCLEQILPHLGRRTCSDARFTMRKTGSPSTGIVCQTAVLYFQTIVRCIT